MSIGAWLINHGLKLFLVLIFNLSCMQHLLHLYFGYLFTDTINNINWRCPMMASGSNNSRNLKNYIKIGNFSYNPKLL